MPLTELLPFPADQKCSIGNVGIIGAAALQSQAGFCNFKTRRARALRGANRKPWPRRTSEAFSLGWHP